MSIHSTSIILLTTTALTNGYSEYPPFILLFYALQPKLNNKKEEKKLTSHSKFKQTVSFFECLNAFLLKYRQKSTRFIFIFIIIIIITIIIIIIIIT